MLSQLESQENRPPQSQLSQFPLHEVGGVHPSLCRQEGSGNLREGRSGAARGAGRTDQPRSQLEP